MPRRPRLRRPPPPRRRRPRTRRRQRPLRPRMLPIWRPKRRFSAGPRCRDPHFPPFCQQALLPSLPAPRALLPGGRASCSTSRSAPSPTAPPLQVAASPTDGPPSPASSEGLPPSKSVGDILRPRKAGGDAVRRSSPVAGAEQPLLGAAPLSPAAAGGADADACSVHASSVQGELESGSPMKGHGGEPDFAMRVARNPPATRPPPDRHSRLPCRLSGHPSRQPLPVILTGRHPYRLPLPAILPLSSMLLLYRFCTAVCSRTRAHPLQGLLQQLTILCNKIMFCLVLYCTFCIVSAVSMHSMM